MDKAEKQQNIKPGTFRGGFDPLFDPETEIYIGNLKIKIFK